VTKAERLTQLRKLAKLSRKDIAKMVGVSDYTYKGWENARFGGLPKRRATRLVDVLQTEGIKSSVNWVMEGVGEPPQKILCYQDAQFKYAIANPAAQSPEIIEQLRIKAELEFFCNNNEWKTLSLVVPDNAMEPCFVQGDVVAGIKVPDAYFGKTIGLNCIVRIKQKGFLLCQIQKSKTKNLFTLSSINPTSKNQVLFNDVEPVDIAPVTWLRRKSLVF